MINGLDHIGIAVRDLDAAVKQWQQVTGARIVHREIVSDQRVVVAMIMIGTLKIELIQPTADDSPVARFLVRHSEGIHHIALECSSTQEELDRARQAGVRLVDEFSRAGVEGSQVGFVHPQSLAGVLVELLDHAGRKV